MHIHTFVWGAPFYDTVQEYGEATRSGILKCIAKEDGWHMQSNITDLFVNKITWYYFRTFY